MPATSFSVHSATGAPEDKYAIVTLVASVEDPAFIRIVEDTFTHWPVTDDDYTEFMEATLQDDETVEEALEDFLEGLESHEPWVDTSTIANKIVVTTTITTEAEAHAFTTLLRDSYIANYISGNYKVELLEESGSIPDVWANKLRSR